MHNDTRLAHGGRNPARQRGAVNPPVYHASTVIFDTLAELEASRGRPYDGMTYGLRGTPLHFELERLMADLEGAHDAVVSCSGLAAIAAPLLSVAESGVHLLVADNVYGPTRALCDGLLKRMGVDTTYFDPALGAQVESLIQSNTRAVFIEAPGSWTFEICDVPAIAAAAHAHDCCVMFDNTWATPLYFQAFDYGVDISIHAGTKYVVGHADAMLGLVNSNARYAEQVRRTTHDLGYCAGPDDVYLGLRGLRTMSTRLRQHESNALTLANWLADRPEVAQVLHPARKDHPQHDLWQRDFSGSSGLFAIVLRPVDKMRLAAMLDGLEYFGMGYSWGGFESLILPVEPEKVRTATQWPHAGQTLRIHAGLENVDDLIADLAAGFERMAA